MRMTRMFAPRQIDSTRTDFAPRTVGRQQRTTSGRRNLANAIFLRRRERLFGMAGHYAAACSAWAELRPARAGVVRISQSAVTTAPPSEAKAITPSQCSAGILLRAAHARTFTGRVPTDGAAATLAAPPSAVMSEA